MLRDPRASTSDEVTRLRISKKPKRWHGDSDVGPASASSWPDVLRAHGYTVDCAPEDGTYLETKVFSGFVLFPGFDLFVDVSVLYDEALVSDVINGMYTGNGKYHHKYHVYVYSDQEAPDLDAEGPAKEVLRLITGI